MVEDGGRTTRASAAEVCRNFGLWQDRAMRGPVLVTNHGRPKTVLLSIESYEGRGDTVAEAVGAAAMVVERIAQGFVAFDDRLRLTSANRAACDQLGSSLAAMTGLTVAELFGGGPAAPIERLLMRVLVTGEARRAEVPGMIGDRALRIDAFAIGGGAALLFDMVDGSVRNGVAERDALMSLIADAGAASARINLRGCLVDPDDAFAALCDLPVGTGFRRLADMVRAEDREEVGDMVERVLGAGETLRRTVRLAGDGRSVTLAIAPTRTAAHMIDGALAVASPAQPMPATLRMVG